MSGRYIPGSIPEWFYHGTRRESLPRIKQQGLKSSYRLRNDDEAECWGRDPERQHLLYATVEDTRQWGDKGAQLRFQREDIPRGVSWDFDKLRAGEVYLTSDEVFYIEPEDVEIFSKGKWRPLVTS